MLSIWTTYAEYMLKATATVKQGVSNLLICFLVIKIEHMLGACLAGRWEEAGYRLGQ
jgi:hypothetical protein